MSTQTPPPGWHPDPEDPESFIRYWDGERWTVRQLTASAYGGVPQTVSVGTPLGRSWRPIGVVVRIALLLVGIVTVAQTVLYAWGLSMFEDALNAGDLSRLDRYDDLDMILGIALLVALLLAGVSWMVWQYQLARSASPGQLRRGPAWHAFAWITPIVGLWFPYQNIKDLWRRRFPDRSIGLLAIWWTTYVAFSLLDRVYIRAVDDADTLDEIIALVRLELTSAVITLISLALAIVIHRNLTEAEIDAGATPGA